MVVYFHTPEFLAFFLLVFAVYWRLPLRGKNVFLLAASYGFYATWNWKFLGCLLASTLIDYFCGQKIYRTDDPKTRKRLLILSLVANLGMLGYFKYANWFIASMVEMLAAFGIEASAPTLDILLPIGISFYTFQTLSYTLDIYRRKLEPTTNPVDFALFVVYFPQLIAGPIEKARDLLPQIQGERYWKNIEWAKGIYLYAYGVFVKVAIADPVAVVVNQTFGDPRLTFTGSDASGTTVLLALYAYALQIYCDFQGYSKMARGVSLMLGIRLSRNFYLPFFATGYIDFYKRWHITLSSWIGEYVYMPLYYHVPKWIGLRSIQSTKVRLYMTAAVALLLTRITFGLWHGASMSFVILGFFIYFGQWISLSAHQLTKNLPIRNNRVSAVLGRPLQSFAMVNMFAFAMLMFRSHDLNQIATFAGRLFTDQRPGEFIQWQYFWKLYVPAVLLWLYELVQYRNDDEFVILSKHLYTKIAFVYAMILIYLLSGAGGQEAFIYFQF